MQEKNAGIDEKNFLEMKIIQKKLNITHLLNNLEK